MATETIYTATDAYASWPTDTPVSTNFLPTLLQGIRFTSSVIGTTLTEMQAGWGEITLNNAGGDYDYLATGYAFDGGSITIRDGDPSRPFAEHTVVLSGQMDGATVGTDEVTITIRDFGTRLDTAVLVNTYGGTGGADGTEDFEGKRKPRVFGRCRNITAPLVIPTSLAYQLSDGPISAVSACYVRGAALTAGADYATLAALLAATVPAGSFATCLAEGWGRIAYASSGESGQVTWDVSGDATGGYVETTGGIVQRLLTLAGLTTAEIDTAAFTALDAAQSAPVGFFLALDDSSTFADVIARLVKGIGAWAGFTMAGVYTIGRLVAPAGTPVLSLSELDIAEDGLRSRDMPADLFPPPWRWRVKYDRNWTTQESDLAGSLSASRKAWLAEESRTVEKSATAIQTAHPLAQDLDPVESYFANKADATAEATRLLALHRVDRRLFAVTVPLVILSVRLGDVISVSHHRLGLSGGRLFVVAEITVDAQAGTTEFVGWG